MASHQPAAARVLWYLREVMGENAYDHYLEHQRRDHPDDCVLSRREFERRRMDGMEIRPGQRCC
ncbi:MAG TPA: YbdD/YjiX family protein [Actinomycetes bacterium]|nr:YbdD/YjiX family protein [Actinomycetes bacterium]